MRALTEAEIRARLASALPKWALNDGAIARSYRFAEWKGTIMALNAVAFLAEAANHHPDLTASYNRLGVRLSTHDVGGISEKDFSLAGEIEKILGNQ